ncbi:MAG TPA: hypothetical protein VF157_00510 [Chloroflexota bacterium]
MAAELVERILADCRQAVGEVRFGFGSKRQVWAFEERHQLDAAALAEELARAAPDHFLELAIAFHDEFVAVSNAWRVRDRIESLMAELCRAGGTEFLARVAAGLVDNGLAARHWLVAAFSYAPPPVVVTGLEQALDRAYQPADHWALLARLAALAEGNGWILGPPAVSRLAELAQFSPRSDDRIRALELLARLGGSEAAAPLARAARGDADPHVRAYAAGLL